MPRKKHGQPVLEYQSPTPPTPAPPAGGMFDFFLERPAASMFFGGIALIGFAVFAIPEQSIVHDLVALAGAILANCGAVYWHWERPRW